LKRSWCGMKQTEIHVTIATLSERDHYLCEMDVRTCGQALSELASKLARAISALCHACITGAPPAPPPAAA